MLQERQQEESGGFPRIERCPIGLEGTMCLRSRFLNTGKV